MKKMFFTLLFFTGCHADAQSVAQKLAIAVQQLEADSQMQHAVIALSVYDGKTGLPVYERNAQAGLAAASTQKLFTSCAAFDLLGKDYKYTTIIAYNNWPANPAKGHFLINPSGDPSFGSSRYNNTKPAFVINNIVTGLRQKKIDRVSSVYRLRDSDSVNTVPGGWIWEDVGNYYGAPAMQFNWLENQYDIILKSGNKVGDKVSLIETRPSLVSNLDVHVTSAEKGSGDNSIVYLPYNSPASIIEGTIPVNENNFVVSAALTNPSEIFTRLLFEELAKAGITVNDVFARHFSSNELSDSAGFVYTEIYTHFSPPFDSLNYWFLKKSINLYGEAFIKTMAQKKWGIGSTEKGVELLKDFWSQHGIEKSALHIQDGSGLSPQNRVTAAALVKVLQYAKTRPWFDSFYNALPEYNGMKMKSGSIGGARAYAGYQSAKDGSQYCFAIIINNYDGASSAAVKKMYKVLDVIK
jgi:D-alanyl-D-alanine carboxypeptidase/D-alanyl-D-alanine-endopeptidase (penicillin-binding protein 4)